MPALCSVKDIRQSCTLEKLRFREGDRACSLPWGDGRQAYPTCSVGTKAGSLAPAHRKDLIKGWVALV